MPCRWRTNWVGVLTMLSVLLVFSMPGDAHERRTVGKFVMSVGWADEPTYAGFKNGVQLLLRDASDKPVTDLPEDLKVEVIFGTQKFGPLALEAAFGKRFGTPGDYRAPLVPTRPGNYTFHFIGSLDGQRINESFTSSDKTFDPVAEASGIQFPAKDPSAGELAGLLERLSARVESVQTSTRETAAAARAARTLGAIGIAAGIAGLIVALGLSRRRASGPSAP